MNKYLKCFFIALLINSYSGPLTSADDSVLVSGYVDRSTQQEEYDKKINQYIEKYVQQSVINEVMKMNGEIMQRIIQGQHFNFFPQIAYNATQEVAVQVFKQADTKKITQDAYNQSLDKALMMKDDGEPQESIQKEIGVVVERIIRLIREEPVYHRIIEEVLKQSMRQQQKIIAMTMAQRQAQMAMIQQVYQQLQKAIIQQYQQAMQKAIQARMQKVNQMMVEQQTRQDILFQQYQQQVQQQYLRQQQLQQQYQQMYGR